MWLHSLKVAQLLRSTACLHTNQSRSYLNHLVILHKYRKIYTAVHIRDRPKRNCLRVCTFILSAANGVPKPGESYRASIIVHCTKSQVINDHGVPTAGLIGKHSYILLLQTPHLHSLKVVHFSATAYHLFRSWIHFSNYIFP